MVIHEVVLWTRTFRQVRWVASCRALHSPAHQRDGKSVIPSNQAEAKKHVRLHQANGCLLQTPIHMHCAPSSKIRVPRQPTAIPTPAEIVDSEAASRFLTCASESGRSREEAAQVRHHIRLLYTRMAVLHRARPASKDTSSRLLAMSTWSSSMRSG